MISRTLSLDDALKRALAHNLGVVGPVDEFDARLFGHQPVIAA